MIPYEACLVGKDDKGRDVFQDWLVTKFFKKPQANWLIIQSMGALSARCKFSTLAAEVHRRLRNTNYNVHTQAAASILSTFMKAS